MTDTDPLASQVPSAWQAYIPILASVAGRALAALGGVGFTWALAVNASQIQMAITAGMILVSLGLGARQKIKAQRALNIAAASPPGMTAPKLPA